MTRTAYYICHPVTGARQAGPYGLRREAEARARQIVRDLADGNGRSVQAQRREMRLGDGLPVVEKRSI